MDAAVASKKQQQQQQHTVRALQRHHIEIALVLASGCRLCAALACRAPVGGWLDVCAIALVYACAVVLEFGSNRLGSPYCLRRSASHGIAQGVLAVPSVLAALVAAAPSDGWQPWLHGSCAAAVAVLGVIQLQSMSSNKTAHSKTPCSNGLGPANAHNSKQQQSQHGVVTGGHIPMAVKPGLAGTAAVPSLLAVAVLLCSLALASKPQQQHQWPLVSQQLAALQAAVASFSLAGLQLCGWAVLAAVSFCLALQLLPGCFSLGEAALMAQGAACLTVTAAKALQHAALFVPSAVCSQLPRSALTAAQGMGGCMAESHKAALSLLGLPAVISLVLAAAVVACLLLTALYWSVKGSRQQQQVRSLQDLQKQGQSVSAGCALSNGTSTAHALRSSGTFAGPSPATVVVNVAAAIVAAAGICMVLLWLTCAAAWTLLEFLPAEAGRLGVLLYWVGLLAVTLPALKWLARAGSMPQIIVRKVYHLLAIGLFVPVFFWDLQLLALSLAIAFAVLVLLEVLRCIRLPLLGQAVQEFMQAFVDERDTGVIYITHFTLLLGLAVPMWLCLVMPGAQVLVQPHPLLLDTQQRAQTACASAAGAGHNSCPSGSSNCIPGCSSSGPAAVSKLVMAAYTLLGRSRVGWSDAASALVQVTAGLSGLVVIGVGDTAASFVGKLFGRVPVHVGSSKTVEGTLAGISASLVAWVLLLWVARLLPSCATQQGLAWWVQLVCATAGAGLMEAATSQLDNILLPLWYLPQLLLV